MQRSPDGWVIDASVAAKWYLRDEALLEEADHFAHLVEDGGALVTAPHLSRHEIASTLASACRSGRKSRDAAGFDLVDYVALPLSLETDPEWLLGEAMDHAIQFEIAIHDAVYLALAQSTRIDFITADKKLWDLVTHDLPFVHWLGNFRVP